MKLLTAVITLGVLVANGFSSAANRSDDLKSLVNSEREFAQRARVDGMQEAFLTTLTDNAVVFRPLPANGKIWYGSRDASKALLVWEPVFADVSASGDLGYTTGPWEYLPEGEGSAQTFFGDYFSLWKKTRSGGWMVVVDIGVNHDGPYEPAELITATSEDTKFDHNEGWRELADLESGISEYSGDELREHYAGLFDDDVRYYRSGILPQIGLTYASEQLSELPSEIKVNTLEVVVSESGDLGYAYGTQEVRRGSGGSQLESYLRVWRKQGDERWHIVADFALTSE